MNAARTVADIDLEIATLRASKSGLDAWSRKDMRTMDRINDQIEKLERSRRSMIRCGATTGKNY